MTAPELEVFVKGEFGNLRLELAGLRSELKAEAGNLRIEDKGIDGRVTASDAKLVTVEQLTRDSDRKINDILTRLAVLEQAFAKEVSDREKWGGRVWQFVAVAFGSMLTAAVAVLLTLAGLKKP